jgi:pimeloyl-ACP methyl ester carboxylesterase
MKKQARFDVRRLAVSTSGSGAPAVLVHGFASTRLVWRGLCRALRDDFTCHAIDLPGCGESPAPAHFSYTLEHLSDVLADFIVMKDLREVTLVGASLGAAVILLALLRNRDVLAPRLKALCLIGAVAYPQNFPFALAALRSPLGSLAVNLPSFMRVLPPMMVEAFFAVAPPRYARFRRRNVRAALLNTARLIDANALARYVPRLKTIGVPTLLVWGRDDRLVPLRLGRRLHRDLPSSRLVVIDRCGHRPHVECPDKVAAALKKFAGAARPALPETARLSLKVLGRRDCR